MNDFAAWSRAAQDRIEAAIAHLLPRANITPERLHAAMRYVSLGGGKRVRPMLVYAAAEALGGAPAAVSDAAAAAVELIHVYSLVHDDLPCMDNDDLRRGRPTCHVEYDEATALLVGDALQSLAFEVLSAPNLTDPAIQRDMLHTLARASGSRGMAGGQAVDLASTGQSLHLTELEFMHGHKTGALIRAAVLLGGLSAGPLTTEARHALERYAHHIGLAFQVMDDVLDAEADTATLGKTAGKDAAQGKATYLTLMSPAEARRYATELIDTAQDAIAALGPASVRLAEIARFIVSRAY